MEQRNRQLVEDPVCTTEYVFQETGIGNVPLNKPHTSLETVWNDSHRPDQETAGPSRLGMTLI